MIDQFESLTVYTTNSWEHALSILRVTGPARTAGVNISHGNDLQGIHIDRAEQGDAILIQRDFPRYSEAFEQIVTISRQAGKPLIYELDDLITDLPAEHPDRLSDYYTSSVVPILQAIVQADLVTVSTKPLADYVSPYNPNVTVLPNMLDESIWSMHPPSVPGKDRATVIGYMGSNTHSFDIESIADVISYLSQYYGDRICFHFWGIPPLESLRELPNVYFFEIPATNYADYAVYALQQSYDIFLAPLTDNLFNRCKSGIKFLEYTAMGIPGVYSKLEPYSALVEDGSTGLLASTSDEWMACISRLVEDVELRHTLAVNAQQAVSSKWLLSKNADQWRQAWESASANWDENSSRAFLLKVIRQTAYWQGQTNSYKILTLEEELAKKNQRIQDLETYLNELYSSKAWRFIRFIWGFTKMWRRSEEEPE